MRVERMQPLTREAPHFSGCTLPLSHGWDTHRLWARAWVAADGLWPAKAITAAEGREVSFQTTLWIFLHLLSYLCCLLVPCKSSCLHPADFVISVSIFLQFCFSDPQPFFWHLQIGFLALLLSLLLCSWSVLVHCCNKT